MDTISSSALSAAFTSSRHRFIWYAALSLMTGLFIGYASRGVLTQREPPRALSSKSILAKAMGLSSQSIASTYGGQHPVNSSGPGAFAHGGHMPTLAEMKQIADKQAAPLLEKLTTDPNNAPLLAQIGSVYHSDHQFKDAAVYYDRAVKLDPKNVPMRVKLATSLYRGGDVDGALNQLSVALREDPRDANSLFNLGMIRLQGKQDGNGALAAWKQLLKSNPQLSPERKATVQKLMADVAVTLGSQSQLEGSRVHDRRKLQSN